MAEGGWSLSPVALKKEISPVWKIEDEEPEESVVPLEGGSVEVETWVQSTGRSRPAILW